MSVIRYRDYLTTDKPLKSLTKGKKHQAGRNSAGRITTRHQGGGHKQTQRIVDFLFDKKNIPARGAWAYHETLIPNTARKPLRIWLEVGSRDNGFRSAEDTYRNWPLANNRMADALKAKGYAYQYVWAQDAGHVERGVERQTLEEAMEWVWKRQ